VAKRRRRRGQNEFLNDTFSPPKESYGIEGTRHHDNTNKDFPSC